MLRKNVMNRIAAVGDLETELVRFWFRKLDNR